MSIFPCCLLAAVVLLTVPAILSGQRFSFGFIGGTNLTRDFPITRILYPDADYPDGLTTFDLYSDTNSLLAGLVFETALSQRFSLEVNALHRNLHLKRRFIFPDGQRREDGDNSIGTWEWPLLLKYRLALGRTRPFLEAGPSFRTRKNPVPSEPSQFGTTVGAGSEFRVGRLRLSPSFRYTRWRFDGSYPRIATKRDQFEFLTTVTYATSPASWRVYGRKIRLGVVAGMGLTGGLVRGSDAMPFLAEEQGYSAGLSVAFDLNRRLSIEANGLYRPFRAHSLFYAPDGSISRHEFTVLTWQFPVLAKLNLRPSERFRPVVELGPSFRLSGNRNGYNPSSIGFTIGAGTEARAGALTIGPVVRYTRWAEDANLYRCFTGSRCGPRTRPDQVEVLLAFSF